MRKSNATAKKRKVYRRQPEKNAAQFSHLAGMESGAALVEALLYGKMDGLSPETIFLYGRTGLLHLFSASGFHMAAALMMARLFSRLVERALPSPWRKYFLFALSLALMVFFGCVTAWSSPLVRAFTFTTLLQAARLLETRPSRLRVFLLSLLLAFLFGEGSTLSFLLSALGMAGVLWGGGTNIITLALGPWLFTLPLVVWAFGVFSLASPLWNLSFGLLVSFAVLPLAITDLVLAHLHLPHARVGELANFIMERLNNALLLAEAHFDFSYWVEKKLFLVLALFFLGAYFWRARGRWIVVSAALAIVFLWPTVKLSALDVGQGDAIYLLTGKRILVDAGPPGFKGRDAPVNHSLEGLGISALDQILLTHPDRDHIGGIPSLLTRHRVREALWTREENLRDPRIFPILAAAERANVPVKFLRKKVAPPGFECWLPPYTSANESSPLCYTRVVGGKTIWLTGDAGMESEDWLMSQVALPTADFLKVGHHGSKFSSGSDFLRATGAKTALVSVGAKNRYGHPTQETLSRLAAEKIEVRRTDQEGSVSYYW